MVKKGQVRTVESKNCEGKERKASEKLKNKRLAIIVMCAFAVRQCLKARITQNIFRALKQQEVIDRH